MSAAELPRLLAIVLVVFDNEQGGQVAFEVPEGSVGVGAASDSHLPHKQPYTDDGMVSGEAPAGSSLLTAGVHAHRIATAAEAARNSSQHANSLFDLDTVSAYIMPARPVVRHLVTICVESCKVLGFPVWIDSQHYPRGRFMYNVCFAFERNAELTAYEPVVRKTGRVLRHMEETTHLLSNPANRMRVHSILEQVFEDLGSYSETSIPLDGANTLDLKLFPQNPNPAVVRDCDVPVALVDLNDMRDESWDITMYSIAGYIDGTRSVKRIANMADVDLPLARECVQHLLFYGCIILHDLFQFTNSYALVDSGASLALVTHDDSFAQSMQAECEAYVSTGQTLTPFAQLFIYYTKLRPTLPVEEWIDRNAIDTEAIDVRRLINFGIIKGFVRRVHTFPVWLDHPSFRKIEDIRRDRQKTMATERGRSVGPRGLSGQKTPRNNLDNAGTKNASDSLSAALSRLDTRLRDETPRPGQATERDARNQPRIHSRDYPISLPDLLDGQHSTDELCVRYRVSFRQLKVYLFKIGHPNISATDAQSLSEDDLGSVKLIYT